MIIALCIPLETPIDFHNLSRKAILIIAFKPCFDNKVATDACPNNADNAPKYRNGGFSNVFTCTHNTAQEERSTDEPVIHLA